MKHLASLFTILLIATSCATNHTAGNKSNVSDYWNRSPDLTNVTYSGGNGMTLQDAIIIKNADNEINGVAAEYAQIAKIYGVKFKDQKPTGQSTINNGNKKIDFINIQTLPKNDTISFYFDITDFYGKF